HARQALFQDIAGAIGNFAHSAIMDFKNVGDALENLKNQILSAIIQAMVVAPLVNAITGGLGAMFGGGGGPLNLLGFLGFDEGGFTGKGSKYQPAGIVHAGEFVFSAAAVRRIGVDQLHRMHEGAAKGFASGGYVGSGSPMARAAAAGGGGTQV